VTWKAARQRTRRGPDHQFCNYRQCQNTSESESGRHTDEGDHNEIPILEDAFKNVELVLKFPAITELKIWAKAKVLNTSVVTTGLLFSENHLDHVGGEQPRSAGICSPIQQGFRGGVCSEGRSGERIYDGVNPESLNNGQDGRLLVWSNGGHKSNDGRGDVG